MKNKEVVQRFINKQAGVGNNLYSGCTVLTSYSTNIAEWYKDMLILNYTKYSPSTSRHQYYLKYYTPANIKTLCLSEVPINTTNLIDYARKSRYI